MGKIKCAHNYVLKSGRCYYCGEMTSFVNSQKAKIVTEPLEKKSTGPIEVSTSSQPLQEVAAAEDMAPDFANPNKRLAGGFLYSYEAGTMVPLPCYSDAALTIRPQPGPQEKFLPSSAESLCYSVVIRELLWENVRGNRFIPYTGPVKREPKDVE